MDDLECSGTEKYLHTCKFKGWGAPTKRTLVWFVKLQLRLLYLTCPTSLTTELFCLMTWVRCSIVGHSVTSPSQLKVHFQMIGPRHGKQQIQHHYVYTRRYSLAWMLSMSQKAQGTSHFTLCRAAFHISPCSSGIQHIYLLKVGHCRY